MAKKLKVAGTFSGTGEISDEQIKQAVSEYLEENPVEGGNGEPGKDGADGYSPTATVTQNADGAVITITDKNGTTTATLANGKDGQDGKDGVDGYTPVKGVDYFTPAEVQEIAEQAAGMVDVPGGGTSPAALVCDITLEEEVQTITINTDMDGNPLELEHLYIRVATNSKAAELGYTYFRVYVSTAFAGAPNNDDLRTINTGANTRDNSYFEGHAVIKLHGGNVTECFAMTRKSAYDALGFAPYGGYSMYVEGDRDMDKIVSVSLKNGVYYPAGTNIKIYKLR